MRWLIALILLLPVPAQAMQMIGFGGAPPGGTLLVGTDDSPSTYLAQNPDDMYSSPFTAEASGTANTAYVYYNNTNATNCKVCVYESGDTGDLLECVVVAVSGTGWKSAVMAGTLSITASTGYRLGVVCGGYQEIGANADMTYNIAVDSSCGGSYSTPIDPNCKNSTGAEGLHVYITN
jgi:hypothetical protein